VLLLDSNLTLQFLNLAAEQLLEVSGRKAIGLTLVSSLLPQTQTSPKSTLL